MDLIDFIIPLAVILVMTLALTMLGTVSAPTLLASASMAMTVLIWSEAMDSAYLVIMALLLGTALWMSVFGGRDNE